LYTPVAMKFIDVALLDDQTARARFITEARAAAALKSTHIVHVYDCGIEGLSPFIAMELLVGESLADRIECGPLSPEATAHLLVEMARGMRYAHQQGVVHRDLKPENIFLAQEDDLLVTKILDFGVARIRPHARGIQAVGVGVEDYLIGTPSYISPEQALAGHSVDERTDLWAMAVITYECLTGRRPFEASELSELLSMICLSPFASFDELGSSEAVRLAPFVPWFRRALAKDPQDRFQSAQEMADTFYPLVHGVVRPESLLPPSMHNAVPSSYPPPASGRRVVQAHRAPILATPWPTAPQVSSASAPVSMAPISAASPLTVPPRALLVQSSTTSVLAAFSESWYLLWQRTALRIETSRPFRYAAFSGALLGGMLLTIYLFGVGAKDPAPRLTVVAPKVEAAPVLDLDKSEQAEVPKPPVKAETVTDDEEVLKLEDLVPESSSR
jgi:serine/threonine-protein kinase